MKLPLRIAHSLHIATLPTIHGDLVNRLLVAEPIHEDLPIVTSDAIFARYPVTAIW